MAGSGARSRSAGRARSVGRARRDHADRLSPMEAVFISLMALVVLGTGWVALVLLHRLVTSGA